MAHKCSKVACAFTKSPSLGSIIHRVFSNKTQDGPGLKEFIAAANSGGGHQLEVHLDRDERVPYLRDEDTAGWGRKGEFDGWFIDTAQTRPTAVQR